MRLPKWRKLTWVFVIVQVLFVVWIIAGASEVAGSCEGLRGNERDACEAGTAIGATIGVGVIVFLWVLVDVILGITWLVTNRSRTRECPRCGTDVAKGLTSCPKCGYDWATATA